MEVSHTDVPQLTFFFANFDSNLRKSKPEIHGVTIERVPCAQGLQSEQVQPVNVDQRQAEVLADSDQGHVVFFQDHLQSFFDVFSRLNLQEILGRV